jgi:hypothetical protein
VKNVTLMMEATCSPETSVLTTATRRNIPEDGTLHDEDWERSRFYHMLGNSRHPLPVSREPLRCCLQHPEVLRRASSHEMWPHYSCHSSRLSFPAGSLPRPPTNGLCCLPFSGRVSLALDGPCVRPLTFPAYNLRAIRQRGTEENIWNAGK